ncbi:MAG: nuclear transport factor 2 family protein, partial [Steroidobacteraceae bacterium]
MDYWQYVQTFNSGDDARLVREYFTEDCLFQLPDRRVHGREALLKFLRESHDGVREIIRPQVVLQDEHHLFAEIDMDFHATRDEPGSRSPPLRKGDVLTVKFFTLYVLRDGRIAQLKAATWPANMGVLRATPHASISASQE